MAASAVLAMLLAGSTWLVHAAFLRAPDNPPGTACTHERADPARPAVVAAGSSSTMAALSADWVGGLRHELGRDFEFVNAGSNGDTAAGLLARLDTDVIACHPAAVTVFIGGNDARDGVPVPRFQQALVDIVERLQARTTAARIALLSLPPQGEDLASSANRDLSAYNAAIHDVAADRGVTHLPLHERLVDLLDVEAGSAPGSFSFGLSLSVAFERYALGRTWDDIAAGNGLQLLTDHLHLSDRAGHVVTALVAEWLVPTTAAPDR